MNRFSNVFSSSLGKKLIMASTGLFLCIFLIIHLIGNLKLFQADEGFAFNSYAHFMTTFIPIKIVSYLLYLSVIIHAFGALIITRQNKRARPIKYAVYEGRANSSWSSRNMGILGTVLLVFIVIHMSDFWARYKWGGIPYTRYETSIDIESPVTVINLPASNSIAGYRDYVDVTKRVRVIVAKDLYKVVKKSFSQGWYVFLYVLSMLALSFHLIHGFKSGFESLGWDHKKYMPVIKFIGTWGFGLIIPLLFATIPLYFFFF